MGATIPLAMDIRIASETARIGFVFSQRGLALDQVSSWFLPRIVGILQALEWCYSGRIFSAQEALAGRLDDRFRELGGHGTEGLLVDSSFAID